MVTVSAVRTPRQKGRAELAGSFGMADGALLHFAQRRLLFVLCAVWWCALTPPVAAQNSPIFLLSESNSTRAVAFDSVTFTREPFPVSSLVSWSSDRRTRVILLALNLPANVDLSAITADAEDVSHRHYVLKVERAALVPRHEWMSSLTLRLSDELTDVGDVLVRITYKEQKSNRVRIGIGHLGGGLIDDSTTPTSPYLLRGRVTEGGLGFPGIPLTLQGTGWTVGAVTNSAGEYQIATVGGDYVLYVSHPFYDFTPSAKVFDNLSQAFEGVDFVATRQMREIYGVLLDDNGQVLPNVELTLTSNNFSTRKATTDFRGIVAFNVPAGFAYTLTPGNHNIFAFTPQSIAQLSGVTTMTFSGVRREYTISGRVKNQNAGVADATVKLQETGEIAVSDASGNYSFPGLKAGFDYTILVSREDYLFEPASFSLPQLDGNRQLDIQGRAHVFLTGRVVDQSGRGIFGVKVNISGTESGIATTRADGSYSFLVTAFGNFVLTPEKEQDYYAFQPKSANLTALKNSRVAEFTGTLNASVSPSCVLEFDGSPKTVDYSMPILTPVLDYNLFFWNEDGLPMGHFFWEFWAMPIGTNASGTYIISDGYGGAHAILFGVGHFGQREPSRYQLIGNIWNGSFLTNFASDEGPAANEWGHFATGWDGTNIVVYFNGVPVGKTAWLGPRITPGGEQGTGRLLIGGSDHSNFIGRIAQIRGYEENNPLENAGTVFSTFVPQTVFAVDNSNILSYYFRPAETVADLSWLGHHGRQHTGLVRSTANGVLFPCAGCPLPEFVVDPTAPDFAHPANPGTINAPVNTPATVPGGALIFDSFSRPNATYVLSGLGGLNSSEGGSSGPRAWQTNAAPGQLQPFGILNGRAVLLANSRSVAWVNVPAVSADLDIRVERHPGVWGVGLDTGLSFRVSDANNYFFAYTSAAQDPSQPQVLTVGYYSGGVRTELATGIALPADWTALRVVTQETGAISISAAGTLLYSTNSSLLAGSTGAGFFNNGPGLALTNRWDNFTVFAAP